MFSSFCVLLSRLEQTSPSGLFAVDSAPVTPLSHGKDRGWLVRKWTHFDSTVMKPIFGGEMAPLPDGLGLLDGDGDAGSGDSSDLQRPDVCIKRKNSE